MIDSVLDFFFLFFANEGYICLRGRDLTCQHTYNLLLSHQCDSISGMLIGAGASHHFKLQTC